MLQHFGRRNIKDVMYSHRMLNKPITHSKMFSFNSNHLCSHSKTSNFLYSNISKSLTSRSFHHSVNVSSPNGSLGHTDILPEEGEITSYGTPNPYELGEFPLEPVVKVFSHSSSPNHILPWQSKPSMEKTGSGFIVEDGKIITNAHVINDQTLIMVRKFGDPQPYPAKVIGVGNDCDLALLSVEDEQFWENTHPLKLGNLPHLQETVNVVGYPTGGDNVSITRGVISRIEPLRYAFGFGHLLAIQIDAAINAGNSGGPAMRDNEVVGVAFQSLIGAENIGYIIPIPVVNHFLEDLERHNGKYTGFGALGIQCQPLINPQLRAFMKMSHDMTGVLVNKVEPIAEANKSLQRDDIILSIDGVRVANDGTVPFRQRERIFFDYLLTGKFVGDKAHIEVFRKGEIKLLDVILSSIKPLVPVHHKSQRPSFLVHGGLVFTTLTQPFLMEFGDDWFNHGPRRLAMKAVSEFPKEKGEEVVVLSSVLVDEINYGYQNMANIQVLRFNGEPIKNIRHLGEMVAKSNEPYDRFDFDDDLVIVLDAETTRKQEDQILATHGIPCKMYIDE